MFHRVVAAAFQDVQESGDVAADIHMWILRGITHTGLCREVDHPPRLVCGEHGFHRHAVGQVGMDVGIVGMLGKSGQAGPLDADIVIVAQVVEADHLIAAFEQPDGDMRADESGSTCNKDTHRSRASRPRPQAAARI